MEVADSGGLKSPPRNKYKTESEESAESKQIIQVNSHQYIVDEKISEDYICTMYKVHDTNNREFLLRNIRHISITEYMNCVALLKGKSCIASYFEYQYQNKSINIVFETGNLVDPLIIPKNLLKRRVRQILTAISSINSSQLHFSQLDIDDFIDTNSGFRFINIESTMTKKSNVSERTFAPASKLINYLIEERRITLDPKLYREIKQMAQKAEQTEVTQLEFLLRSDLFQDSMKVTIGKPNTRSVTPDPHSRVMRSPPPGTAHRNTENRIKKQENLFIIKNFQPADIPSHSHLIFCIIGVFICLFVTLYLHFTTHSSVSFTFLIIKVIWLGISVCGAFAFAALNQYNNNSNMENFIETMRTLKKWFSLLNIYLAFVVVARMFEFNQFDVTEIILLFVPLTLFFTNLLV